MENLIIRNEYVAVIPIDISITILRSDKSFELIKDSKIESFEKNPDIKGVPNRVILEIIMIEDSKGLVRFIIPMWRISW